jgi:hypothetical protein
MFLSNIKIRSNMHLIQSKEASSVDQINVIIQHPPRVGSLNGSLVSVIPPVSYQRTELGRAFAITGLGCCVVLLAGTVMWGVCANQPDEEECVPGAELAGKILTGVGAGAFCLQCCLGSIIARVKAATS